MFYSEKFREKIYGRYGQPQTYTVTYHKTGAPLLCRECCYDEFVYVAYTGDIQCAQCWNLLKGISNNKEYTFSDYGRKVQYPDIDVHYTGVMKAVSDFQHYRSKNPLGKCYIRLHREESYVDFIQSEHYDPRVKCAHVNTEYLTITPNTIRELIKEALDWENGKNVGLLQTMTDFLLTDKINVYRFE